MIKILVSFIFCDEEQYLFVPKTIKFPARIPVEALDKSNSSLDYYQRHVSNGLSAYTTEDNTNS